MSALLQRLAAEPGRWLCNLGYHQPQKRGRMSGYTERFEIKPGFSRTLSHLICQRCGRDYLGSVGYWERRWFP